MIVWFLLVRRSFKALSRIAKWDKCIRVAASPSGGRRVDARSLTEAVGVGFLCLRVVASKP